jgi:hypothetical protein
MLLLKHGCLSTNLNLPSAADGPEQRVSPQPHHASAPQLARELAAALDSGPASSTRNRATPYDAASDVVLYEAEGGSAAISRRPSVGAPSAAAPAGPWRGGGEGLLPRLAGRPGLAGGEEPPQLHTSGLDLGLDSTSAADEERRALQVGWSACVEDRRLAWAASRLE